MKCEIKSLRKALNSSLVQLLNTCNNKVRPLAYLILLGKILNKENVSLYEKHRKKLKGLYGADILSKEPKINILNLSNIDIKPEVKEILALGLNCHLGTKFSSIKQ